MVDQQSIVLELNVAVLSPLLPDAPPFHCGDADVSGPCRSLGMAGSLRYLPAMNEP